MVPDGKRDPITAILDEEGIDYVMTEEVGQDDPSAVVSFPLPTPAVESVLERLREVRAEEDAYTVVTDAETVVSQQFEELEARYEEDSPSSVNRIAREELSSRAQEMSSAFRTFLLMTAVAALIATTGLLLDSTAVVVGSMVIAPLLGPAMSASVGTVLDDDEMFQKGFRYQAIGLLTAVLVATVFALSAQVVNLVPPGFDALSVSEISSRVSPDLFSLIVAFGAGIVGAWSLASGASTVLVGVMVAAALVPPLGIIGIGIAFGLPRVALSAAVLVLVNVLTINLTALAVFWYKGYRPENWSQQQTAKRRTKRRAALFIVITLLLSSFLGVVSYDTYRTAQFEQDLQNEVPPAFNASTGNQYQLMDINVQYQDPVPFQQPKRITLTVSMPPGAEPPNLPRILKQRVDTRIKAAFNIPLIGPLLQGNNVGIEIHYIVRQQ